MTVGASALPFTNLVSFNNETFPSGALVQASDGNLYGVTENGGSNDVGTVYRLSTNGDFATIHSFSGGAGGAHPYAGLIEAGNGNLYGTTLYGGAYGNGTVFRITTNGLFTRLYSFAGYTDGAQPAGRLVRARDGKLYGTASAGGGFGVGTIFSVTTGGSLTPLHWFSGTNDGAYPVAGLTVGPDGDLYGATVRGSVSGPAGQGFGVVFRMTISGSRGGVTPLRIFNGNDGAYPFGELELGTDGAFYGTTAGTSTNGSTGTFGTIFKITAPGAFTPLYTFAGAADGANPYGALLQASDGKFYGTTVAGGGASGKGTLFQFVPGGSVTNLHTFTLGTDGGQPYAGLAQGVDGNLYGTTSLGGINGGGTVFRVDIAAPPFIVVQPAGQTSPTHTTATFSVLAGGTPPLSFRWLKNSANLSDGGNIAGSSTATLTLSDVSAADAAPYSVLITSPLGQVTSAKASLAVKLIRPTLTISQPKANARLLTPSIQIAGKAKSPLGVDAVFYQLNGGDWNLASSTNGWTNWTADATLVPGPNQLQAVAVDPVGNLSLTNHPKYTYVLKAPLSVATSSLGTVNPNYNGKLLEVGQPYKMTARPDKGSAFTNWTGSISTNTPKLSFVMASNLAFTANFVDVGRPVLAILSPKANQKLSQDTFTVTGKARDNVGVTAVYWQLNGQDWIPASTTNRWTNWTAAATLTPGSNTVQAYAEDARGNLSLTSRIKFFYLLSAP